MDGCNSANMFATKGGLIYSQNANVSLSNLSSNINNPSDPELNSNIN